MKNIIFFLLLIANHSFGQKIYLNKEKFRDGTLLEKNMTALSQQVFDFDNPNPLTNAFNKTICLVIEGKYADANRILDSVLKNIVPDTSITKGIVLGLRTFNDVMAQGDADFETRYRALFRTRFLELSAKAASITADEFDNSFPDTLRRHLNDHLKTFLQNDDDSISLNDATSLCQDYALLKVYAPTYSIATEIIRQADDRAYLIEDSVLIKTSDNGTIALTIARRKDISQPQPVVLAYNIYPGSERAMAKSAAAENYIGIVVNTRGKRLSPDDIEPFEHDAKDAYDILDWISKQPWCNGKIGMYGGS